MDSTVTGVGDAVFVPSWKLKIKLGAGTSNWELENKIGSWKIEFNVGGSNLDLEKTIRS